MYHGCGTLATKLVVFGLTAASDVHDWVCSVESLWLIYWHKCVHQVGSSCIAPMLAKYMGVHQENLNK